jgi:hypothetical protein
MFLQDLAVRRSSILPSQTLVLFAGIFAPLSGGQRGELGFNQAPGSPHAYPLISPTGCLPREGPSRTSYPLIQVMLLACWEPCFEPIAS